MNHNYAQTRNQLFNQLIHEGYSNPELSSIAKAYELAKNLFPGLYRVSGKTFITHTVGAASILASIRAPAKLVAAGLIHSIYKHGDFGGALKGVTTAKRKQVRQAVGNEVEEYAYRFATLQWNSQTRLSICNRLHELNPIDREVVLMRIVNELEDHLDLGFLYGPNAERYRQYIKREGHIMVEMAQKLDLPNLAAELEKTFKETIKAKVPLELQNKNYRSGVIFIAPESYSRRLSVAFYQELFRGINYLRHQLIRTLHRFRSAIGVRMNIRF